MTDAHLGLEVLADLDETDLLAPADEAAARAHLAGCDRCQTQLDSLSRLRTLLADVGARPEPLPAQVADRLDRALADAAVPPSAAAADSAPTLPGPATTDELAARRAGRSAPRGMRILQAAAAIVLVLGLGGIGVGAFLDDRSGGGASSTAGGAGDSALSESLERSAPGAAGSGHLVTSSGRNWDHQSLLAAAPELVASALSPTTSLEDLASSGAPEASDGGEGGDAAGGAQTGGDDSAASAREQAPRRVAKLAGGNDLDECVAALTDEPVEPVVVDLAEFRGRPAAVIVLPTPGDPATLDVWVVRPGCGAADAQILDFLRVARP